MQQMPLRNMFFFEFRFRIKGTYFYSAHHLIFEKILSNNQELKLVPEPNNPFDTNAVTLWLPLQNLPISLQNNQTLEHEKWQLQILNYQYLYRLPTKLSRKLSTSHLTPETNSSVNLSPIQINFKNLHWHFMPHQWLIGYLPRRLAKLVNPLNTLELSASSKIRLRIIQIESAGKIFAKLELHSSFFQMIKLGIQLIRVKHHNEFFWKLKLRKR